MKQFDMVRATVNIRPSYQGHAANPRLAAFNGQGFAFMATRLMGEDDPYPGEWQLYPDPEALAPLKVGWVASGDVSVATQAKEQ